MKIILVIFALAFSLSAGALMPVNPDSECWLLSEDKRQECWDNEEEWIKNAIEEANYCKSDSDCTSYGFGCPFGCGSLVNKSEVEQIKKWVLSFYKTHDECEYKCYAPVKSIACEEGVCVAK